MKTLYVATLTIGRDASDCLYGDERYALVRAGSMDEARALAKEWGDGEAYKMEGDADCVANVEIRPAPTTNGEWEQYFAVLESEEEEAEEAQS